MNINICKKCKYKTYISRKLYLLNKDEESYRMVCGLKYKDNTCKINIYRTNPFIVVSKNISIDCLNEKQQNKAKGYNLVKLSYNCLKLYKEITINNNCPFYIEHLLYDYCNNKK